MNHEIKTNLFPCKQSVVLLQLKHTVCCFFLVFHPHHNLFTINTITSAHHHTRTPRGMRLLEQHPNNLHSTPHSFLPTCTPPQTPWRARHITTHSHHSRIWHSVNVERLTRCRHASPTHRLATRAANQDAKLRTRVDAAKGSTETVLASSTQQTAETIKADLTTMVEHPPASATPPHHPARWLWWVDSNEEEMRVINFSVNLGLIVVCAAAAAAKFVTVDIDSWGSLSATDLLLQLPSSNWKLYEEAVNSNPMLTKVHASLVRLDTHHMQIHCTHSIYDSHTHTVL